MRTLIYSCPLLVLLVTACKKHNDSGNVPLVGTWKQISWTNGFIGRTYAIPSDSIVLLTLNNDHTFQKATNGTINESGSYYSITLESIFTGKQAPALSFVNPTAYYSPLLFEIRHDTLDLAINGMDGNSYQYVRYNALHPMAGGR